MEDSLKLECKRIDEKYVKILRDSLLNKESTIDNMQYMEKNFTLEDVEYLINHLENLISVLLENASKSCIISKLCELTVGFGLVHRFTSEDRDYSCEDFPHTAENAEKCFAYLRILLKEFNSLESSFKHHFLVNALLLCATHNQIYIWSSSCSVSSCKDFLDELLQCTQQTSLSSLLCDDFFYPTIFKGILKKMRTSLMKDTWMLNPSSCYVFYFLLSQVKHPYLVDYLPDVLPPCFMFVSYYNVPQKVLGIQCFNHILDNVPQSYIKLDGIGDAIYNSLHHLTYSKDVPVVEVLFPCLLKLPMMKTKGRELVYWGEYDQIFNHLLINVEFESNIVLKRLFFSHIKMIAECNPPFSHLKRLMAVINNNLCTDFPDVMCIIEVLKILKVTVKSCWPRIENYCVDVIFGILRIIWENFHNSDEIKELCEECLTLLKFASPKLIKDILSLRIEDPDEPGVEFLKQIISKE